MLVRTKGAATAALPVVAAGFCVLGAAAAGALTADGAPGTVVTVFAGASVVVDCSPVVAGVVGASVAAAAAVVVDGVAGFCAASVFSASVVLSVFAAGSEAVVLALPFAAGEAE